MSDRATRRSRVIVRSHRNDQPVFRYLLNWVAFHMRSQFLVAFRLKCNSAVSKLGREVVNDMYSTEMIQKYCEGFRTPKITSETLLESNIWYWISLARGVYSCSYM